MWYDIIDAGLRSIVQMWRCLKIRIIVFILMFSMVILVISGCSSQKNQELNVESSMNSIISYKLNEVEDEHTEKVNQWLANAKETGAEGQYFLYQDSTKDNAYSYVYGKGYSDYEVSFIYDPSDPTNKGKVYVNGIKKNSDNDTFIQIKTINDLSILFVLSDESLQNKLK